MNLRYEKVYIVAVFHYSLFVFLLSDGWRFQASLSTNIFGDKVYKDNRGNKVKYSKTMWERVPGKDRPCFEDFLFSELIHKYCNRRNVNEVYEIDIFGDAQYRSNQGLSMTLKRNIMGELEYSSNEFRATLGKDIFENVIYKDNRGNKVTYSKAPERRA